jgi:hypothetical protein
LIITQNLHGVVGYVLAVTVSMALGLLSVIRMSAVMIIGGWAIEVLDGIIRLK